MPSYSALVAAAGLEIEAVVEQTEGIQIQAYTQTRSARCPHCQEWSHHIHGYYVRRPADLPLAGQRSQFQLRVKRFRCLNMACQAATFVEPLPDFLKRYQRRSTRLVAVLEAVADALGGQAGSRLSHRLQMPCSGATLLRLLRRRPLAAGPPPVVIGLDDWARRRGHVYGTLVVDLERHRPIALLDDRDALTVATWLQQHPSIQVIARDRFLEYVRAVDQACPESQQVADRWHLASNLRLVVERMVTRLRSAVRQQLLRIDLNPGDKSRISGAIQPVRPPDHARYSAPRQLERQQQRARLFDQMQALVVIGTPQQEIARRLGVASGTVKAYLRRGGPPAPGSRPPRPKKIDPYLPHIYDLWRTGCRNASYLWRAITAQGFQGPRSLVARWVRQHREAPSHLTQPRFRAAFQNQSEPPSPAGLSHSPLPNSQQLAWFLLKGPDRLSEREARCVQELCQLDPLRSAHDLAQRFLTLMRSRSADQLDTWLSDAANSGLREFKTFANGLRQDLAAVRAAFSSPWSNGQTEGQVNKLKLLKRQMYGRAKLDLLRARLLYGA